MAHMLKPRLNPFEWDIFISSGDKGWLQHMAAILMINIERSSKLMMEGHCVIGDDIGSSSAFCGQGLCSVFVVGFRTLFQ